MKLLGLLPLTSLTGIFALNNQSLFAQSNPESKHLIAFISIFAASLTLSLFIYEIRVILRCHNLVQKGEKIEKELKIHGQFSVCTEEHMIKKEGEGWRNQASNFFDPKLAACVIYSIVYAAWLFTAIRFGFKWQILGCALTALGFGLLIGIGAFKFVKNLVAA